MSTGTRLVYSTAFSTPYRDNNGWKNGNRFFVMDIDGDQRDDLVARYASGTMKVWKSDGARLVYNAAFSTPYRDNNGWKNGNRFFVMDIDGDQRDDLVARYASGTMKVWMSTGTRLVYNTSFSTPYRDNNGWKNGNRFFVMDIDGDQRDDLVARYASGTMKVWKSDGRILAYNSEFSTPYRDADGWKNGNRFFVMNSNRDRKLVARSDDGTMTIWLANGDRLREHSAAEPPSMIKMDGTTIAIAVVMMTTASMETAGRF